MLEAFGDTQKSILFALRNKKEGLTTDHLAEHLFVTRTAVRQHMTALERLDYVEQGQEKETGGRPAIVYKLSQKGLNLFPKQYAWFSELLLESIQKERGNKGLEKWMEELGKTVGNGLLPQLKGKVGKERLMAIGDVMNQLNYEASIIPIHDSVAGVGVEAVNCVYHALASRFSEVCAFDLTLLSTLTGNKIDHTSCMVKGGTSCRFAFKKK